MKCYGKSGQGKKDPSTFFFAILLKRRFFIMREKTKNVMRSAEEKEAIIVESYQCGCIKTARKYDIQHSVLKRWRRKYREQGIEGLRSKTGKTSHGYNHLASLRNKKNKTREEELELENLKLKVEVARLKKGYQVKGVGSKKEYVTIKDLNMKS